MFTNKHLTKFYFKPVLDEQDEAVGGYYPYRCSPVRQQEPRTGWSNLAQRVKSQYPDYAEIMRDVAPAATALLVPWIRQSDRIRFGRKRWVVMFKFPLHACENAEPTGKCYDLRSFLIVSIYASLFYI